MKITAIETRTYRHPIDPPLRAAWDPEPRREQEATIVSVHTDEGVSGHASGDLLPDRALLERLLVGLDPFATERVRELCETVDFHGGRPWTLEVAVWDVVGRALDQPLWRILGGRRERIPAYASAAHVVDPAERAERAVAMRDRGIGAIKLRLRSDDWRTDIENVARVREVVGSQMELMVDANQGWRMAGDVRPRWDVGEAAQCARELEALGVYWLEEPLATDDLDGYAALRRRTDLRLAAGEMVRQQHEARDLIVRGGVDVVQTDVVLSGGIGGCRRVAAVADLYRRTWSPHTWSNGYGLVANLHAALAFSTGEYLEVPIDPPEWSAAARDWLLPAPVEIDADGAIAAPWAGPWCRARFRRARTLSGGVMEPTRITAAVLHEAGEPLQLETLTLDPPGPDEVRVRIAAAGVCHSDLHLAEGHLGSGRWPIVLGHEGAGVIEAVGARVTHLAVGDPVAFCFVPPCRMCATCRAGRFHLCTTAAANAWAGTLFDGTSRLRFSDGRSVQHFNFVSCFAEQAVMPAASAIPLTSPLPLWQAALMGCGVVTGVGAVRNTARVRVGETVAVIGCGGVGLQAIAGARLAGAGRIIAVDRSLDKLERATRMGAGEAVDASSADAVEAVLELVPGGVDYAFEVVGLPVTIRQAWDMIRPGGSAIVVGLAPKGAEVSLPALDLLSEKNLKGCYYGSSNVSAELPALIDLVASGRLDVADVVSDVIELGQINEAFDRLRAGEGSRSVIAIDPTLAGVAPGGGVPGRE